MNVLVAPNSKSMVLHKMQIFWWSSNCQIDTALITFYLADSRKKKKNTQIHKIANSCETSSDRKKKLYTSGFHMVFLQWLGLKPTFLLSVTYVAIALYSHTACLRATTFILHNHCWRRNTNVWLLSSGNHQIRRCKFINRTQFYVWFYISVFISLPANSF